MKMIKRFFKWYCKQFEKAYGPLINAGVNPWM